MSRPKGSKNKIEKSFPCKVALKSLGKYYHAEGASVLEAILNLKVEKARGVSVLTIEKDGLKKEKILGLRMTAKLFGGGSPLDKEILLKKYYADIL